MIQRVDLNGTRPIRLDDYAVDPEFAPIVADLRAEASQVRPLLRKRRLWMVNSTAKGGGVAEMLPRLIRLMGELDLDVEWVTINTENKAFFALTKRLHNLIHGVSSAGIDLGPEEARLYEEVNRENAESLRPLLGPRDILMVHDPQPLPLGAMLSRELGLPLVWRCHIGLDERNDATNAAWRFLRPYLDGCAQAIFSAPEYIPSFLAGRSTIVHPGIDPLSHKNRPLTVHKTVGILCNGGVQKAHHPIPTTDFRDRVHRLLPDGSTGVPGDIGLLFRPIVLQVSRWDRLKGWLPLMEGFLRLKRELRSGTLTSLRPRNRNRLELARLVLAGPDPASIQDDPEGVAVFGELCEAYLRLDPAAREEVVLLSLPMESRKENALIVNALQRCASLAVQNSLREGFGLTVTEAMWKSRAVLGTRACGIREQIRDHVDGILTVDPLDAEEISRHLRDLLTSPADRYRLGRGARRRVHQNFLVFDQIERYVRLLAETAARSA